MLAYELGTTSDRTVVSSNLTLGGTLNITDAGGFTTNTYTLFTYGRTLDLQRSDHRHGAVGLHLQHRHRDGQSSQAGGEFTGRRSSNGRPITLARTNSPAAAADADPDGDGMSNTNEFLAGTNPTNSLSGLRILSIARQSNDVNVTWATAGGRTNAVQATGGDANGGYTTNFVDIPSGTAHHHSRQRRRDDQLRR